MYKKTKDNKKAGRKSNVVTEENKIEAKEILELAFKDVGFVKSKLTYNSVCKFNERIANNEKYVRENGELFNIYPVRFWSREYNGVPYYGKQIIDERKADKTISAGEIFELENKDIYALVDRYHNKPDELKKRLADLFEKDRKLIKDLKHRNGQLTTKVDNYKNELRDFQEGFATLFWNSSSTFNSLDDIITLERNEDSLVHEELLNMFGGDEAKVIEIANRNALKIAPVPNETNDTVIEKQGTEPKTNVLQLNLNEMKNTLASMGISSSSDSF